MKKWILPMAVIAALLSKPSFGESDGSNVYSMGLETCSAWNNVEGNRNDKIAIARFFGMKEWVYGYISGADAWLISESGFHIKNTRANAITQWVSLYCQDNPLSELQEAAEKLIMELAEKL